MRNPWGRAAVTLYRDGKQEQDLDGDLLKFDTAAGSRVMLVQRGASPGHLQGKPPRLPARAARLF
jgi:hypothetical protein